MPTFEWICRECNIWWDRLYDVGKAPNRTKCPKCTKLSHRYWQQQGVAVSFKDDGNCNKNSNANDFYTVRRRYQKVSQEGYDKDSANKFLHKSIRDTKKATDEEAYRYKSAEINWDKFADSRGLKKVGEKEAINKQERSRKLTIEAYDRANKQGYKDIGSTKLDIAKPNKNKPT